MKNPFLLLSTDHRVNINMGLKIFKNSYLNFLFALLLFEIDGTFSKWCNSHITIANGRAFDTLTSSARYKEIINKPTHTVRNWFSCIDLISCKILHIIWNYGVDLSIFEKFHYNIIFGKINIRIPFPPSYVCEVWDYGKVNVKSILKAIQTLMG